MLSITISNLDTLIAVLIFLTVVVITLLRWEYRLPISIAGVSILLLLDIITYEDILNYMNFNIILFLTSMMIIVGYLEESNYFTFLISKVVKHVHGSGVKLFVIVMILSAFFSAVVDQVTAILFLSALSLELSSLYEVDPYPLLLATLFSIIVGGTATVIGDPVSIIIAFEGGLTMSDFIRWATPITIASLFILIVFIIIFFWKDISKFSANMRMKSLEDIFSSLNIGEVRNVTFSTSILASVLLLIIFHVQLAGLISKYLNISLSPETFLLLAPLLISSIVLLKDVERGRVIISHKVDWNTLMFFLFFFTIVGSLIKTGVLNILENRLLVFSGDSPIMMYFIITISTGLLSIAVANIMTVATVAPIIKTLYIHGFKVFPIWWGMLFSTVFMGLSTPVGTTASLVLLGILDRRRIKRIPLNLWIKSGLPIALIITFFALLLIYIQLF